MMSYIKPAKFFNESGQIRNEMKIWTGSVTPSTSNGYSIDISAAGFTALTSVSIIAERNTATATACPFVMVKSKTTSAVVVNIIQGNPATTTILGINVLSGAPDIFDANPNTITLHVTVIGY